MICFVSSEMQDLNPISTTGDGVKSNQKRIDTAPYVASGSGPDV